MSLPLSTRRSWVEPSAEYSVRRQCRLAGVPRSGFYYVPVAESEENLLLMRLIDEQYMRHPEFGYPRMTDWLNERGYKINHKRIARLMRRMGLQAITPGPHTSKPSPGHKIYPYLLRDLEIERVNQVWSTDITYIPMRHGFLYLTAVMEWYSRYVLAWELSNTLESQFCVAALKRALMQGTPEIFNTDQGAQFTSEIFTGVLLDKGIGISMDGRGRVYDNIFVERLWRTVKYEEVYLHQYLTVADARRGLKRYFHFYNTERIHESLGYKTPHEIYFDKPLDRQTKQAA